MKEWINTLKTQANLNPDNFPVNRHDILNLIVEIETLENANKNQQELVNIATKEANQFKHFNLLLRRHITQAQLEELEKEMEKFHQELKKED